MNIDQEVPRTRVLEVRAVTKSYGSVTALERVTFNIAKGELVGLIGPNGAGKTTILEIVEGIKLPTSGAVTLFGEPPDALSLRSRGRIGLVFQRYSLPGYITVRTLIDIFCAALKIDPACDRLRLDLGLVHLQTQRVSDLSAGQQQRLAVYAALLGEREFVMLDEPTSALDLRSRKVVWDAIIDRKQRGNISGLLATHHLVEAALLCDRLIFLREGIVCDHGPTSQYLEGGANLSLHFSAPDAFIDAWELVCLPGVFLTKVDGRFRLNCPRRLVGRAITEVVDAEAKFKFKAGIELVERAIEDAYLEIFNDK